MCHVNFTQPVTRAPLEGQCPIIGARGRVVPTDANPVMLLTYQRGPADTNGVSAKTIIGVRGRVVPTYAFPVMLLTYQRGPADIDGVSASNSSFYKRP